MKRMLLRLSALTAVMSLGTYAVVEAQRSHRTAQADAAATADSDATTGEPAPFIVDERTVKPMPQPTVLETAAEESPTPAGGAAQTGGAAPPAGDPFTGSRWNSHYPPEAAAPADRGAQWTPEPEDPQAIPPAPEAMRRYDAQQAAGRTGRGGRGDIRPLTYDEGATAAQSPDDVGEARGSAADEPQPTLAPPRPGNPFAAVPEAPANAPPEASFDNALPEEPAALPGQPEAEPAPAAAASRYSRAAQQSLEPALLPEGSDNDRQAFAPATDAGNFAPPANSPRSAGSASAGEGQGRPGGRHLEGPQVPHLTIEKVAPTDVQVGKPAVFTIKVRNTGAVPATRVEIHDTIPKGTQLLSTTPHAAEAADGEVVWTLGSLKPAEETTVQLELMPVTEGEIGSVATVHFAAESSVRTLVTKPVLTMDVKNAREVLVGEEIILSIALKNTGSGAATGVVVREVVPDTLQHPAGPELEYEVGTLKPGESRQLDLKMRAVKAGRVQNTLSAIGEGSLRVDQVAEFEAVAPSLAVKMEGPTRRYLDRQATYTVTMSNPGTATAKDVSLVTYLPTGLKFVEANNAGQYDPRTRSVQWSLEELPANETGTVTLTTVPVEVGEQVVRIESSAERGLAAQDEKTILVEGVAAINFEVVDLADPVEVGGETGYEIRVVNQGTKTASNVQVVALLPEELKPTSAEGPARFTIDGQRVLFEPLAQLAPKADTTYRVKAEGRGPGDVRVRVQIITDEIRTPVTKEESTRVYTDEQ
ncbi:MAG TPA: hypothetical protein VHD36_09485 [Pirellulales bacterium]|nr:hypothetical protein [Pirellulales bacterium]